MCLDIPAGYTHTCVNAKRINNISGRITEGTWYTVQTSVPYRVPFNIYELKKKL